MTAAADGWAERWLWRGLRLVGALAGPRAGRGLAAAVMRRQARTGAGYDRGMFRVATRLREPMPGLVRLPPSWWTQHPRVRVHRLGLDLRLDLRDNLQRTLYATGTYEPATLAFLRRELRAGDVLLDIGAHIGIHALTAAAHLQRVGGGTVVAFEPARDAAAALRIAALRNGLEVTLVEAALGDAPGRAVLRADPRYGAADLGVRSLHGEGEQVQTVPVTTVDRWAAEAGPERVDVVKLDVEGAELAVLRGMRATLARCRPRAVVVEVKDAVLQRADVDPDAVRAELRDAGYVPTGQVFLGNEVYRPGPG